MKCLSNYIRESGYSLLDFLLENKIVNFKHANPSYNQCVILAGGAASGKGMIQSKIDIEGKVFDVDEYKQAYRKLQDLGKIADKREYDLANPEDTSDLHQKVKEKGWKNKERKSFWGAHKDDKEKELRLPNVIFDMVSGDIKDVEEVAEKAKEVGYTTTIVWVVTNVEVAKINNACRGINDKRKRRSVPDKILIGGHEDAYKTMTDLFSNKYPEVTDLIDYAWIGFGSGVARVYTKDDSPVIKIRKSNDKWNFNKSVVDEWRNKEPEWNWKALDEMKEGKFNGKDDKYAKQKFDKICEMSPEVAKHYGK